MNNDANVGTWEPTPQIRCEPLGYASPMLSPATVDAVAQEFDLGVTLRLSGPTARGEQGETFRLDTSTGSWAVKRPFTGTSEEEVAESAAFAAAASRHGVPAPAVRRTVNGDVLLSVDGGHLRVYEWVDLRGPDPSLDPVAVGAVVAAIHTCGFRGHSGEHFWYRDPVGRTRWTELSEALAAARAPFADPMAALVEEFVQLEALIGPPVTLQTCHRDLFADNLRSTESGALCVIDWDNCGLGDPSQELAFVLFDFGLGSMPRTAALYDAYRAAGGPGQVRRPADFSMIIASLGHINERACTRWLDADPDSAERSRMAGLFGETVDRPLTRTLIEQILDTVAGR